MNNNSLTRIFHLVVVKSGNEYKGNKSVKNIIWWLYGILTGNGSDSNVCQSSPHDPSSLANTGNGRSLLFFLLPQVHFATPWQLDDQVVRKSGGP